MFDLKAMIQTNVRVSRSSPAFSASASNNFDLQSLSKRSIKRVQVGGPRFPVLGSVGAHSAPPTASAHISSFGTISAPLPFGWKQIAMPDGRSYFHNDALNMTQWERPVDAPSQQSLPSGWVEQRVADGRPYYVNASIGLTAWHCPSNAPAPAPAPSLPANWIEQMHAGVPFYVNTITGQSTWDPPVVLATAPPSAPHSDTATPENWIHQIDASRGLPFWINAATGKSTWNLPPAPALAVQPASSFSPGFAHHLITSIDSSNFGQLSIHTQPPNHAHPGASSASAAVDPPISAPAPLVQRSAALLSAPMCQVAWKWESDDGSMYNDFDPDTSLRLETAWGEGNPSFSVPEKSWMFDLKAMTQTNHRTLSKRRIQRLPVAPAVAAPVLQSNQDALRRAAQSFVAAQSVHVPELPFALQSLAPDLLGASQSHVLSIDFGAAIQELAIAAKSIPIDIVHGVFVRRGSDVQAAKEIFVQMNLLHEMMGCKVNFPEISAAMCACSDSFDDTLEMLLREQPGLSIATCGAQTVADADPTPVPTPALSASVLEIEKALCLICMDNSPTHAFIPCGHKQICGACSTQKVIVDGLKGKCPTCRANFQAIVHIFED